MDGTITDTATPSQSGRGSNSTEGVRYTCQSFRTRASLSDPDLRNIQNFKKSLESIKFNGISFIKAKQFRR